MNSIPVKLRKAIYGGGMALALAAIIVLGAPLTRSQQRQSLLAGSRQKHDLGEASLGNVDVTSATMNLVLLGMRGIAASALWYQADQQMMRKDFLTMRQTVESIVLLQPHYETVWRFQAWNLGYNVSVEYDAVDDRYYWVKEGAKFLQRGVARNHNLPELYFDMGQFLGKKLGMADEKESYRRFFLVDPDEESWGGGPDEDLNPEAKDNYLVARDWYLQANDRLQRPGVTQHTMDLALFIAYPYRSLMDYSQAIQQDGISRDLVERQLTGEERKTRYQEWTQKVQDAWNAALREWSSIYGRERILTAGGGQVVLETDAAGMAALREIADEEQVPWDYKLRWQDQYRSLTSYEFWKTHAKIAGLPAMSRARYLFAEAKRLYQDEAYFEGAKEALEEGMKLYEAILTDADLAPKSANLLYDEQDIVDEAIKTVILWQGTLTLLKEDIPAEYPLKHIYEDPMWAEKRLDFEERFRNWSGR